MNANQVRTIIISLPDLVDVQAALDLLRKGKTLTALQSGTVAYEKLGDVQVAMDWRFLFDGINYTVFVFVTSG